MYFCRGFLSLRMFAACMVAVFAWPLVGASDPLATGTIEVRQTVQCCYREGAMSYVYIRQLNSDQPAVRTSRLLAPLEPTLLVGTELSPGRYLITSFQRACDGNCGFLDPPIDQCSVGPLELRAGEVLSLLVSVVPFSGCTIAAQTDRI